MTVKGLATDTGKSIVGKLFPTLGAFTELAAFNLYAELKRILNTSSQVIDIHAHSQGAIITHNALVLLRGLDPQFRNLSDTEWNVLAEKRIRLTTYGPAQHKFNVPNCTSFELDGDLVVSGTKLVEQTNMLPRTFPHNCNPVSRPGIAHAFTRYMAESHSFVARQVVQQAQGAPCQAAEILSKMIRAGKYSDIFIDKVLQQVTAERTSNDKEDARLTKEQLKQFSDRLLTNSSQGKLGKFKLIRKTETKLKELRNGIVRSKGKSFSSPRDSKTNPSSPRINASPFDDLMKLTGLNSTPAAIKLNSQQSNIIRSKIQTNESQSLTKAARGKQYTAQEKIESQFGKQREEAKAVVIQEEHSQIVTQKNIRDANAQSKWDLSKESEHSSDVDIDTITKRWEGETTKHVAEGSNRIQYEIQSSRSRQKAYINETGEKVKEQLLTQTNKETEERRVKELQGQRTAKREELEKSDLEKQRVAQEKKLRRELWKDYQRNQHKYEGPHFNTSGELWRHLKDNDGVIEYRHKPSSKKDHSSETERPDKQKIEIRNRYMPKYDQLFENEDEWHGAYKFWKLQRKQDFKLRISDEPSQ